jgi:hypothetical protein
MQRKLKFKIWSNKLSKFISDKTFVDSEGSVCVFHQSVGFTCGDNNEGEFARLGSLTEKRDCIVVYYTGKQDKNKNDIYVGDIVSVRGAAAQVKFGNFESETNKVYGSGYYLVGPEVFPEPLYITKDLSVIGNIYQNPELINK